MAWKLRSIKTSRFLMWPLVFIVSVKVNINLKSVLLLPKRKVSILSLFSWMKWSHVHLFTCFLSALTVGNVLQCTKDVNTSINPPRTTKWISGERKSDWLPLPAYKAGDPACTGVSRPSDGLPANLPEGADSRQDQAALQGCHTPHSYSAFLLCFIFQTSFRQLSKQSSSL